MAASIEGTQPERMLASTRRAQQVTRLLFGLEPEQESEKIYQGRRVRLGNSPELASAVCALIKESDNDDNVAWSFSLDAKRDAVQHRWMGTELLYLQLLKEGERVVGEESASAAAAGAPQTTPTCGLRALIQAPLNKPARIVIDFVVTPKQHQKRGEATTLVKFLLGTAQSPQLPTCDRPDVFCLASPSAVPFWTDRQDFLPEGSASLENSINDFSDTVLLRHRGNRLRANSPDEMSRVSTPIGTPDSAGSFGSALRTPCVVMTTESTATMHTTTSLGPAAGAGTGAGAGTQLVHTHITPNSRRRSAETGDLTPRRRAIMRARKLRELMASAERKCNRRNVSASSRFGAEDVERAHLLCKTVMENRGSDASNTAVGVLRQLCARDGSAMAELVVAAGCVECLVDMVRSAAREDEACEATELGTEAAEALRNLSENSTAAAAIRCCSGVEALMELFNEWECESAAGALRNMAADLECAAVIHNIRGIPCLAATLEDTSDADMQDECVGVLLNLASEETCARAIGSDRGIVKTLLRLAKSGGASDEEAEQNELKVDVFATLQNCVDSENSVDAFRVVRLILELNGMASVLPMLRSGEPLQLQAASAGLLASMVDYMNADDWTALSPPGIFAQENKQAASPPASVAESLLKSDHRRGPAANVPLPSPPSLPWSSPPPLMLHEVTRSLCMSIQFRTAARSDAATSVDDNGAEEVLFSNVDIVDGGGDSDGIGGTDDISCDDDDDDEEEEGTVEEQLLDNIEKITNACFALEQEELSNSESKAGVHC